MTQERSDTQAVSLPADPKARKALPIFTGCLDYFPDALLAVAAVSKAGNDQHNPGLPLHWSREKSSDHADTIGRHLIQRGTMDSDGQRHTAKAAWRILALLQLEIEKDVGLKNMVNVTDFGACAGDIRDTEEVEFANRPAYPNAWRK